MSYRTGFRRLAASDFAPAEPIAAPPREGLLLRGELLSPALETGFEAAEAIPSWNADCPEGSGLWVELRARPAAGEAWTPWYGLGLWSSSLEGPLARGSLGGQEDGLARVATDTLVMKGAARAFQARIRLLSLPGSPAPRLTAFGLAYSSPRPESLDPPSAPGLRGRLIEGIPAWSQMVYPDGGKVWCSPTCLSMVFAYWGGAPRGAAAPEGAEAAIRRTVQAVYDPVFEGHGNWAFNAAYAGSLGYEAFLRRFESLSGLEPWIEAGIPAVLSLSWDEGAGRPLPGAPLARSRGHLSLLRGFGPSGDPAMHEPAAPGDAEVPRSYPRAELEARWLEASGGLAYLVYPPGRPHPPLEGARP